MTSGQVFRWTPTEDGKWFGVDGQNWYLVSSEQSLSNGLLGATGMNKENSRDARAFTEPRIAVEPCELLIQSNAPQTSFEALFRLDVDQMALEADLKRLGPELEPYLHAQSGLRLLRPSSPVEALFSFLCTPNNHVVRIGTMVRNLANYGETIPNSPVDGAHFFPTLEQIASIQEADLRAKGFGYRAANIPLAAQRLIERGGDPYLSTLQNQPYKVVQEELKSLKGVGPKLADCIALFAFDKTEAVPIDTHVWNASVHLYFPQYLGKAMTDLKYIEIGDFFRKRFGGLAAWAQQYLFFDNLLNWRTRKGTF